jgi:hypothetical protein
VVPIPVRRVRPPVMLPQRHPRPAAPPGNKGEAVDNTEHRRRRIRRWLCLCGRRWACGVYLNRRDLLSRKVHPGGLAGVMLVGWTIRGGDR